MQLGKDSESKEVAVEEYSYLKKFKSEPFFDNSLRRYASRYITGLEEQIDSINQEGYKYEQQIKWMHGQLERYAALNSLYTEYSFLANNNSFIKQYIQGKDELSHQYNAFIDLRDDFLRTLNQQDFIWPSDEYKGYQILPNNTGYTLNINLHI